MLDTHLLLTVLGAVVVGAPLLLLLFLGLALLISGRQVERTINRAILAAISCGLLAALAILALMLILDTRHVVLDVGEWAATPRFHVLVKFVFDRLSVPFALLSFVLAGAIAAFSTRYLHRERGYNRFFLLFALFLVGMITASLADTIETLFIGWELVGLSSALLVAYYQERPAPARNGLWVWCVYRAADAALLLGAVVLHHLTGQGDFDRLLGDQSWPEGQASLTSSQALLVGLLLLVAAAGKSGLVPFSGWLPRAMEGPTPSSAIFYGALSVHLGAFLLLRVSPLLDCSPVLCGAVVALGLTTAVLAYLVGSVQTDIKSALSYACLSQVGLIVAEIGLGLRYVALVHLLGHACLRTLQFLRAPTLLHDYHTLENAIGESLPDSDPPVKRWISGRARDWLYRFALERAYLDAWLRAVVVAPFVGFFRWCDARERGWTDWLTGAPSRGGDDAPAPVSGMDELL
jgi:NAD(P)H-quinone oxidoreductase subunit 5